MTLRWWLLSLLSSVVVISSLHMWRHRHRPLPVPVAETESEESEAVLPVPRMAREPPSGPPPVAKPAATGLATVRGRVLGMPEPGEDTEGEVTLVVSDEHDEIEVTVEPDGSFAVELDPGTYRLHAELDDMCATMDEVTVTAEEDRVVVLQLTGAVAIKGTLRPSHEEGHDRKGEAIFARFQIRDAGEGEWSESEGAWVEDNQFTVDDLQAGQRYDLRVLADGFRPVELTGISAPCEGLQVNLVRLPRLRGGFGIARGEACPIHQVTIAADDETTQVAFMDHFCRFKSGDLPPVQRVRVRVSEGQWSFDVLVDIPPHGDPPFLCLRSLCREPTADELSTLEISLGNSPDKMFFASVTFDHTGRRASAATHEIVRIPDLPSGTNAMVAVFARSCRTRVETLVLQPGINRLSMVCQGR